jgi:hypothetical protein
MVGTFGRMGIVVAREGVADDSTIPDEIFVESLPPSMTPPTAPPIAPLTESANAGDERSLREHAIRRAGWASIEQYEEFRRIMGLT